MNQMVEKHLSIVTNVGAGVPARREALEKLAALGDPQAVVPLTIVLTEIEGHLIPEVKRTLEALRATDVLARDLRGRSVEERTATIRLLGYLEDNRALAVLLEALADVDPRVRTQAADALIRLCPVGAVDPLIDRLFSDPEPEVRMAAAQALGEIATEGSLDALRRAMESEADGFVRVIVDLAFTRAEMSVSDLLFWS